MANLIADTCQFKGTLVINLQGDECRDIVIYSISSISKEDSAGDTTIDPFSSCRYTCFCNRTPAPANVDALQDDNTQRAYITAGFCLVMGRLQLQYLLQSGRARKKTNVCVCVLPLDRGV